MGVGSSRLGYPVLWLLRNLLHHLLTAIVSVTVEDVPIPFSPFSLTDCTMLNYFSFEDFIAVAFPDIAGDLDIQI